MPCKGYDLFSRNSSLYKWHLAKSEEDTQFLSGKMVPLQWLSHLGQVTISFKVFLHLMDFGWKIPKAPEWEPEVHQRHIPDSGCHMSLVSFGNRVQGAEHVDGFEKNEPLS